MYRSVILSIFTLSSPAMFAQGLPNLFGSVPKQLLHSRTLAAFPKNTWLENLVAAEDGTVYATDYPEGKVFRIQPDGDKELFATIDGKVAGIALYHKNQLLVTGWDKEGKPCVFKIDSLRAVSKLSTIAGGMFPNGILHFDNDTYLIADSYAGCIWRYDASSNEISEWLRDEWLARSSPNAEYPAANGLKINEGNLYISNTEKQILVKVPLSGGKPGNPTLFLDKVNIDDFTFDSSGNIYAATNIYNSVIKITPDKKITIIADLSCGAAGSTAVIFSKNKEGKRVLYVSTSGGMAVPPPTGLEEGKIIELELP